jgi:hypothetical protein
MNRGKENPVFQTMGRNLFPPDPTILQHSDLIKNAQKNHWIGFRKRGIQVAPRVPRRFEPKVHSSLVIQL